MATSVPRSRKPCGLALGFRPARRASRPQRGARFLLDSDLTTVGRHPEADIFLDDVTVSRRHAEFIRRQSSFEVKDLGSLNGTYYDGVRIESALVTMVPRCRSASSDSPFTHRESISSARRPASVPPGRRDEGCRARRCSVLGRCWRD